MSTNQFLAIVFCIQLWNGGKWVAVIGFIGFMTFGFLAMRDDFKHEKLNSSDLKRILPTAKRPENQP